MSGSFSRRSVRDRIKIFNSEENFGDAKDARFSWAKNRPTVSEKMAPKSKVSPQLPNLKSLTKEQSVLKSAQIGTER